MNRRTLALLAVLVPLADLFGIAIIETRYTTKSARQSSAGSSAWTCRWATGSGRVNCRGEMNPMGESRFSKEKLEELYEEFEKTALANMKHFTA